MSAVIATFLMLIIAQVQTRIGSGGPESPVTPRDLPLPATAILRIRGNKPVRINGIIATSGATILGGAVIETPGDVAAVINFGLRGAVELAPGTSLTLASAENATLRVFLGKGCTRLHASKGTVGEIYTSQGIAGKTDSIAGGTASHCFPQSTHAAAEVVTDYAGPDGLFDLGKAATLAIVLGRIEITEGVALVGRGSNPGPYAP